MARGRRPGRSAAAAAAGAMVIAWLSGCGDAPADPQSATQATVTATEPSASATPTGTATAEPEPTASATPSADPPPSAFPDPAGLVGQELVEQVTDAGTQAVVGTTALWTLAGACIGADDDVCAAGVFVLTPAPPAADGTPATSTEHLLLLTARTGMTPEGSARWQVVDALVAASPDGSATRMELCEGAPGAVIYPGASDGASIEVLAAWGPDAARTQLVELDPTGLTCAWIGD